MKTHKINLNKLNYTIDFPVLFLFFAVLIDITSTWLFVGLKSGTETNPILKELISISIWFIPIYLFVTSAIFVPFLTDILRKTVSYTIGLISILLGLNNFSLIIFNYAFLIDTIGLNSTIILVGIFGLTLFSYLTKKQKITKKQTINNSLKLLLFLLLIGLIQSFFLIIGQTSQ